MPPGQLQLEWSFKFNKLHKDVSGHEVVDVFFQGENIGTKEEVAEDTCLQNIYS